MTENKMDAFLADRLCKYDQWLSEGKVDYSSRVVPVGRSLESHQWVLPAERVFEILHRARSFAVGDCACRAHYRRCDNPLEVCFFINDAADALVAKALARRLDLTEAGAKLALADEHGLVHLTLYNPDQAVFAVCSCCACCCHDLQLMMKYDRRDLVAYSEYVATSDEALCLDCGRCAERCVFGARRMEAGGLAYDPAECYGCGLCVSACPVEAVGMIRRERRDAPKPLDRLGAV